MPIFDLCVECQVYHPVSELTDECALCSCRYCVKLHCSALSSCKYCSTANLCINCTGHAKCCHNYTHETGYVFVGRKDLKDVNLTDLIPKLLIK